MPTTAVRLTVESRWNAVAVAGLRRVGRNVIALFVVAGTRVPTHAAPTDVDANALVRQMVARYQSIQSLSEASSADVTIGPGQDYIQETTLKFKRPNLLLLQTQDPAQGTAVSCCDGRFTTYYSGRINRFMHQVAPSAIVQVVRDVSKAATQLTGLPQNQVLNPLSFLSASGMPNEAKSFHYVKTVTIDGHRAALVTATADSNWLKSNFPAGAEVKFQKRELSLWIDLDSKLLLRAAGSLAWNMVTAQGVTPF